MKKRIFTFLLALVLLVGNGVYPVGAEDANRTYDVYCESCKATHTWYPVAAAADALTDGHYFLAFSGTSLVFARKTLKNGSHVCLLLEDKEYIGNRHIILNSGATLSVQGPGTLSGRGEDTDKHTNATYGDDGGAIRIREGAVCNIYNATVTYKTNTSRSINYGGAVSVWGELNLYSGQIKNGVANLAGGTVYVGATGEMNLYGGSISGGTISGTADAVSTSACVYNSGKILFTNSVNVDSVYLAPVSGGPALSEMLTFRNYTGSVALYLSDAVTLTDGLVLGAVDGDVNAENITLPDTGFKVARKGDQLIAKWPEPVENTNAGTAHDTLEEAVEEAQVGDVLRLNRDISGDTTVSKTVMLDLDGHSIDGTVTAAREQTLYVKDSQTADHDITDGVYGKISGISGNVLAAPAMPSADRYLMHTADDGISFHAVGMTLRSINLRPGSAALYYTAEFAGDSIVSGQVAAYGIAMSVTEVPTGENMDVVGDHTVLTGTFGTDDTTAYSCLLQNIISADNDDAANRRNAGLPVYSTAYVQLTDGSRLTGYPRQCSLQTVLETISSRWDSIPYARQSGVLSMYEKFSTVMDGWSIPNIRKALAEEDQVMKILSIGQSHSQDSIWLLQEVLQTEMPDEEFFVAECLRSVTMVDHVKNANNDTAVYSYCVNTDGEWVWNENWTIRQALQAQRWDYVVINESSRYLGLESTMKKGYVTQMAEFVHDNIDYDFKLLYNWTWTTPTDQTFYDENFEPLPSSTFWGNYQKDYQADRTVHYDSMLAMLEKYVIPVEGIDGVLYSATPIQYATEVMGVPQAEVTDEDLTKLPYSLADHSMYRDYIHLSDYGRLYIAYLWYAQLYGLTAIEEVNVDVIEAHLRQWRWVSQGDVVLTQQMKDWIVEAVNYTLEHPTQMPTE